MDECRARVELREATARRSVRHRLYKALVIKVYQSEHEFKLLIILSQYSACDFKV